MESDKEKSDDFGQAQFQTILKLQEENKQLKEKKEHLEQLLESMTPGIRTKDQVQSNVSPQETLCHLEISKLLERSMEKELTVDEVRKFDILMKNLHNIRDRQEKEDDSTEEPKNLDPDTLIQELNNGNEE